MVVFFIAMRRSVTQLRVLLFFREKGSSEHRLHTEYLKEIGSNDTTLDSFGLADPSQIHIGIKKRADLIEDLIARPPVAKVTNRDLVLIPSLFIRFPHHH